MSLSLVEFGQIVNTFGTKGEVKLLVSSTLRLLTPMPQIVALFTKTTTGLLRPLQVESLVSGSNFLRVKFFGFNDATAVAPLKGQTVYVKPDPQQFIGVNQLLTYVVMEHDQVVGTVTEVIYNPAYPLIKVSSGVETSSFWVPMVDEFIDCVDHERNLIYAKALASLK